MPPMLNMHVDNQTRELPRQGYIRKTTTHNIGWQHMRGIYLARTKGGYGPDVIAVGRVLCKSMVLAIASAF